jgi:hypothetical protein
VKDRGLKHDYTYKHKVYNAKPLELDFEHKNWKDQGLKHKEKDLNQITFELQGTSGAKTKEFRGSFAKHTRLTGVDRKASVREVEHGGLS